MRQRITFFHRPESPVDPALLKITDTLLAGPNIDTAREDRITLALDELPGELQDLLTDTHQLDLRWAAPSAYEAVGPLFSRISPGLHLFYSPREAADSKSPALCVLLRDAFGELDCSSPEDSFTALPVDRFSHSAALQYYQFIPDLSRFIQYASDRLCPAGDELCIARAKSLADAVSLDISYDAISHALKITALWPSKIRPLLVTSHPSCRTEVGVLTRDEPASLEPHELGIAGHLAVMGQDQRPSATLFSFPSRHRHSEATFSSSFLQPTGLHPTLQIQVTSGRPPVQDSYCSPHAYLTLPRTIFADRYQLADELFLRSKNLTALRHITQPVDLEAPDYALKAWGSAVLLELAPPDTKANEPWTAEVPLHLRYLSPGPGGYTPIEIPYPAVFWACTAEEGTKFPTSPFERVSLGYDGLFGPRTVFWHVDPQPKSGGRLTNTIKVPVLDTQKAGWVNIGSSVAILIGFGWLVWKLLVAYLRMGYVSGPLRGKKTDAEKKKQ